MHVEVPAVPVRELTATICRLDLESTARRQKAVES